MGFEKLKKYLITYMDKNNKKNDITLLCSNEKEAINYVNAFFILTGEKYEKDTLSVKEVLEDEKK